MLSSSTTALAYSQRTIVLDAQQAAGTKAIAPYVPERNGLQIVPPSNCYLSVTPGASVGIPMFGGVANKFLERSCPQNSVYIAGLPTGASVTIWEA